MSQCEHHRGPGPGLLILGLASHLAPFEFRRQCIELCIPYKYNVRKSASRDECFCPTPVKKADTPTSVRYFY